MLTSVARINIYFSSQRITRYLLSNFSISSNTQQYRYIESQTAHSQSSNYIVNLHSWKLTHQPREPTLHWNPRFRQQQQQFETEEQEDNRSSENWDSWFQQHQSPSLLPFSQRNNLFSQHQLYFLDHPHLTSMPKRPRESSSPINISNKREKYSLCKYLNNLFLFYSKI
ncbi:unnamed protein product [Rotaria sp. Silwood2]|nr:unnamed protein product [Rotaria sp. Silwood2]